MGHGTEDKAAMKRITWVRIAAVILTTMVSSLASAQSAPAQEQPLGDYARALRKDKKPAAAKQFDNDNMPAQDKLSVVGTETAANTQAANSDTTQPAASQDAKADDKPAGIKPGESAEDRQKTYDAWKDRLEAQKEKTDLLARELDVAQREYQLRAAAMYADAGNRLRSSASWDKEDADYKKKIDEKKKAVDDAKQEMENMQEDARKAGVPTSVRE
jgi:hypothetical protein